jgi:hypothetical protein
MTLSNTPPAGAGQVQRVTKTERLLKHIAGLGLDRFGNPVGIRATALAEATGIDKDGISGLLVPHVKSGRLVMCKITVPGERGGPQSEYRAGPGVPPPEFTPLSTRRAGIAISTPTRRSGATGAPAPALSTPKPAAATIDPLTLLKPQPAVGTTTPAAGDPAPPRGEPAVTAQATPKPAPQKLKSALPPAMASAGDVTELPKLSIDQDGRLQLGDTDDPARWVFTPEQTLAIGDFLHATQGVWRP